MQDRGLPANRVGHTSANNNVLAKM